MLLEELIEGVELTVGVLGDQALPVIEIIPPSDGEFDYENKYNGKSQELCPPRHVDQNIQKQAQEIAVHIHRSLGLRDMSRTDIIIRRSDNVLFTLETNTIPGMTDQSLLPKAAAVAGYSMPELCDTLVRRALQR
jgi:D-alanine-D-alanine ligase